MKKSDSPVESVRRDTFVDELPFSSKVHRAVQLQRYQSTNESVLRFVRETNACLCTGPASNWNGRLKSLNGDEMALGEWPHNSRVEVCRETVADIVLKGYHHYPQSHSK